MQSRQILAAVAEAFDLDPAFMTSQSRTKAASYGRFALFKLMRTHKRMMSLQEIGSTYGQRDHQTVRRSIQRADELIQTEPAFKEAYEQAEQTILNPTT